MAEIEADYSAFCGKRDTYLQTLVQDRDKQNLEANNGEAEDKAKIEAQHQVDVNAIQEAKRRALDDISAALAEHLKALKESRVASIVNACTAVVTGVAAYFSGGLLAGAGKYVAETAATSLGLTSLGATANLLNDTGKMGFTFKGNLQAPKPSSFSPSPINENRRQEDLNNMHVNLDAIKHRFANIAKNINNWQTEAEHDLFYSMGRDVEPPKPQFSDAVTTFAKQKAKFEVQLGKLDKHGVRQVVWNIKHGGNIEHGSAVMFDSDVRAVLQKLTGVSAKDFGKNWQSAQVLSFDKAVNNKKQDKPKLNGSLQTAIKNSVDAFVSNPMHRAGINTQSISSKFDTVLYDTLETFFSFIPEAHAAENVSTTIKNTNNLEEGVGYSLLVGAGRFFVESGQGIKQFTMELGNKAGLVAPDTLTNYNSRIESERALYASTPVANSKSGKVGEFGAGVLTFSIIPGGAGLKGYRLLASGAASGGLVMGMQPVYNDEGLRQRAMNMGVGAGTGLVLTPVVAPVVNKVANAGNKAIVRLYDRVKLHTSKQASNSALDSNAKRLANVIEGYLGKDFRMIKNADGDAILVSKCHTKKIRFDIHDPHGYPPHGHAEIYDSLTGKWKDFGDQHMIFFSDSFTSVNKSNPSKLNKQ